MTVKVSHMLCYTRYMYIPSSKLLRTFVSELWRFCC